MEHYRRWCSSFIWYQLGQNDRIHRSSPVQVGTGYGGLTTTTSSPVQIGALSWSSVAAGTNFSMGINTSGALYTWGLNTSGQLGQNVPTPVLSSPVQVGTSSWVAVAAGLSNAAAFRK